MKRIIKLLICILVIATLTTGCEALKRISHEQIIYDDGETRITLHETDLNNSHNGAYINFVRHSEDDKQVSLRNCHYALKNDSEEKELYDRELYNDERAAVGFDIEDGYVDKTYYLDYICIDLYFDDECVGRYKLSDLDQKEATIEEFRNVKSR